MRKLGESLQHARSHTMGDKPMPRWTARYKLVGLKQAKYDGKTVVSILRPDPDNKGNLIVEQTNGEKLSVLEKSIIEDPIDPKKRYKLVKLKVEKYNGKTVSI